MLESAELIQSKVIRTVDRSLTTQLFQHLRSTGKSVTRFSDRDVEDELLNAELLHGVAALLPGFSHGD